MSEAGDAPAENSAKLSDARQRLVARFLTAVRDDQLARAQTMLDAEPMLVHDSILIAAAVGDAGVVRTFLAADTSLATDTIPPDHTEPIIYAVYAGLKRALGVTIDAQLDVVRASLDAGASANASVPLPDVSDRIPVLYFPCVANAVAVARLLLERGANPTDGESVYHAAQHDHRECLTLLQEFGADLSRGPAQFGNTPLHFLAAHRATNPLSPKVVRGMQWLLEHGADPNVASYGAHQGHPRARPGETPLQRAAAAGHGEPVIRMLVLHGADISARRADGAAAYALAVRAGNASAAEYLASVGADSTLLTPIDQLLGACATVDEASARAIAAAHPGIIDTLLPAEREALGLAVTDDRLDVVQLMVSLGWPLTQEGEWGGTPLHWAAWNGRVAMVTLLLAHGAPVNLRDTRYGSSPVGWVSHGSLHCDRGNDADYPAIVHLLLDAGATRAESFNQWNESPESMARPSVVLALKERGFTD